MNAATRRAAARISSAATGANMSWGVLAVETSNNDKKTDEDTVIIERPPDFAEDDEEVEPPVGEPSRPEIAPDKVRRPPFESP